MGREWGGIDRTKSQIILASLPFAHAPACLQDSQLGFVTPPTSKQSCGAWETACLSWTSAISMPKKPEEDDDDVSSIDVDEEENEIEDDEAANDLANSDVVTKYQTAGKIANECLVSRSHIRTQSTHLIRRNAHT